MSSTGSRLQMPFPWKLVLADKQHLAKMITVTGGQPGVIICEVDGSYAFLKADELISAAKAEGADPLIADIATDYERIMKEQTNPFSLSEDAIVAFRSDVHLREKLSTGPTVRVRTWWARPQKKSVKLINMRESDAAVSSFAYRPGT